MIKTTNYSGKAARGKFSVAFFFVIFRVAIGYARMRSASITSLGASPSFAVTWRLARLFLQCLFSFYDRKTSLWNSLKDLNLLNTRLRRKCRHRGLLKCEELLFEVWSFPSLSSKKFARPEIYGTPNFELQMLFSGLARWLRAGKCYCL